MSDKNKKDFSKTGEDIGTILQGFFLGTDFPAKLKKYSIFNHWPEIVGKEIGEKTKPQKIFKGILYITVTSPTWANELSLMSRQLIEKINKFAGSQIIKELRFKL
ncbi:MAG: DUF721 domain-containing protein [Actinobacteria bacterium]|nr:DUF721 domain-containing protein [Actinomycetota bacterium]